MLAAGAQSASEWPRSGQDAGQDGPILDLVRQRLPYAWLAISTLADELALVDDRVGGAEPGTLPPSESAYNQLRRALSSNAIRTALECHFKVRLTAHPRHLVIAYRDLDTSPRGISSAPTYQQLGGSAELAGGCSASLARPRLTSAETNCATVLTGADLADEAKQQRTRSHDDLTVGRLTDKPSARQNVRGSKPMPDVRGRPWLTG